MATNLFELAAVLTMDSSEFNAGLKKAESGMSSTAGKISKNAGNIEKTFKKMATVAATYLSAKALSGVVSSIWDAGKAYNQQMEDYTTNFKVMLGGNVDAAKAKVAELSKFAASTPFSMDTLAKGTQTLLAFGIQSEKSTDILRMLGDVSLGNADKLQSMANAFGKASAGGKVTGEVVQTMISAGFNPLLVISQQTGESMEALQKRMAAGKVSVEELEGAFRAATSEGGQFYKGMEESSKTVSGMLSTLSDNWTAFLGKLTQPFYKVYKENVLPGLLRGMDALSSWADNNQDKLNAFSEQLGSVVEMLVDGLISALEWITENGDKVGPILTAIGIGIGLIIVVLNPIPAAIAAITAAVVWLITNWEKVQETVSNVWTAVKGWLGEMAEKVSEVAGNIAQWFSEKFDAVKDAIFKWSRTVQGYFETFKGRVNDIVEEIRKWFVEKFEAISTTVSNIIEGIKGFFDGLSEKANTIITDIGGFFDTLKTGVETAMGLLGEALSGIWTTVTTTFENAGKWFIDNVTGPITSAWDTVTGGIQAAIDAIKEFFGWQDKQTGPTRTTGELINAGNNNHGGGGGQKGHQNYDLSFATGLEYVPYDDFKANLHEGEMVLTKLQANQYRKGESQSGGMDAQAIAGAVAAAVVQALSGVTISMDGNAVGELVAPVVDNYIGGAVVSRRFAR